MRVFRHRRKHRGLAVVILIIAALVFLAYRRGWLRDPSLVLVTGYCNCGECCGWEMVNSKPVYAYGKQKGCPKKLGITASGSVARRGTVAADPRVYPFGTRLYIPGFGVGRVEDIGGAIKGRHIDLWFPSHAEAKRWGARWLKVKRW